MSNKFKNLLQDMSLPAFLGFVVAAIISPLVAHIPPHIGWVSFLSGTAASMILGLYCVGKQVKKDGINAKDGWVYILQLLYYIFGGCIGGVVGILAAYFID